MRNRVIVALWLFFIPLSSAPQNERVDLKLVANSNATQASAGNVAPPPLGQLVDIGGRKLHLWCSGRGSPTIVVESGSSGFSIDWALVQPQVAKFARICISDRAGFAWSDPGPEFDTVEQTMDDLHLLLRTAKIRPPYVLVGHSIGGLYVRAFQRRYPEEVTGMVLVDATPEDDFRYMVSGVDKAGLEMTYQDWQTGFRERLKGPPEHFQPWTEALEPFDRLPADLQRSRVWAINKWFADVDLRTWITAASWNREFVALRRLRLAQPCVLGDLPLIVLHRGLRSDASLDQREVELVKMSRAGEERIARQSDHAIQLYEPDLVTAAIRDVRTRAIRAHGTASMKPPYKSKTGMVTGASL